MMKSAEFAAHPEAEVERLLCSLAGIVSARVIANAMGRLDEIHVLASDALHPKQVVRNVESALSAGLGIVIDRRVVSVAQVRADQLTPAGELVERRGREAGGEADAWPAGAAVAEPGAPVDAADAPAEPAPEAGPAGAADLAVRYQFVGHDVRHQTNRETVCHVTVSRGSEHYTGSGAGPSTPLGRAQAAARGLFAALHTARDAQDLMLENAALVEAHGRTFVLIAAQSVQGRRTEPLTGVAILQRSPEEAAILASLHAVNRWLTQE
ncbi:MAG TPA: hypothetical protein VK939_07235 [Longimicrobiales bacterium]|nr:hypothetical protein [Longimicrobiales bacterium]